MVSRYRYPVVSCLQVLRCFLEQWSLVWQPPCLATNCPGVSSKSSSGSTLASFEMLHIFQMASSGFKLWNVDRVCRNSGLSLMHMQSEVDEGIGEMLMWYIWKVPILFWRLGRTWGWITWTIFLWNCAMIPETLSGADVGRESHIILLNKHNT